MASKKFFETWDNRHTIIAALAGAGIAAFVVNRYYKQTNPANTVSFTGQQGTMNQFMQNRFANIDARCTKCTGGAPQCMPSGTPGTKGGAGKNIVSTGGGMMNGGGQQMRFANASGNYQKR